MVQGSASQGAVPILAVNVWEHAYWECHDGEAAESYLDSFWSVVDWERPRSVYTEIGSETCMHEERRRLVRRVDTVFF